MLDRFYPDVETDNAYEIDYENLYRDGYRGIIFDIDNTLVPHGFPADTRAKDLFTRLHDLGFRTMILSNNKEPRVKSFGEDVNSQYIYKAGKPGRGGYQKAIRQMETTFENTLLVGDQLFTDVWGAKKLGIRTFLVQPIHPKEEIQIVIKRKLERIVLYFYHRAQNTK